MRAEWQLLVDDFARTDGVTAAAVVSRDGLLLAKSAGLDRDDADHLAAAATGLNVLAREAASRFDPSGAVRQTVVEMHSDGDAARFLLVGATGEGICLAVVTSADADLGQIAYQMARFGKRVREQVAARKCAAANPGLGIGEGG